MTDTPQDREIIGGGILTVPTTLEKWRALGPAIANATLELGLEPGDEFQLTVFRKSKIVNVPENHEEDV
jgi:hypothetical protein